MTLLSLRGVAARTLLVSALAASSVVSLAASPGRVPAPDPLQGDGRVSAFYTWDRDIPARPGVLLRTEPLPATVGLASAARQLRILYASTDGVGGHAPIAVSG
ncbi:alpha/beta hydrolase, partial [Burkholderia cenocepacia]|nr:alpha/beta hydrolase [Burkholderia cenocepacia]